MHACMQTDGQVDIHEDGQIYC